MINSTLVFLYSFTIRIFVSLFFSKQIIRIKNKMSLANAALLKILSTLQVKRNAKRKQSKKKEEDET